MAKLNRHQTVPLTSEELESLRTAANTHDATNGIFSRALLRYGMTHLDTPEMHAAIADEKEAAAARLSAGAREAVAQRWGNTNA
ncbi:MAG: hypothetical protein WAU30_13345 [Propionicimonas sp.]